ncbi:hypothetical protein JTB14_006200 [Gonioctena quinquepunctata]|nr:hypothetical protein JTB14_006200 [Gonioctena quinquepunctata]
MPFVLDITSNNSSRNDKLRMDFAKGRLLDEELKFKCVKSMIIRQVSRQLMMEDAIDVELWIILLGNVLKILEAEVEEDIISSRQITLMRNK